MSRRTISHSEISTAYDCQAKWDFGYGGRLAGTALKTHAPAARLRAGRAWGRAVAAFHRCSASEDTAGRVFVDKSPSGPATDSAPAVSSDALTLVQRYVIGLRAMNASLDEDAAAMSDHLVYDPTEHHTMALRLGDVLWNYIQTAEPLRITDPEFELLLPIPSRSGRGLSNRYAFEGRLDGIAQDEHLWLVEYKLRDQLTDFEQVARGRQYRRYVWAAERQFDVRIAGIIVDECLSEPPKPARWVKAKRKGEGIDGKVPSEAKDQLTLPSFYVQACAEAGVQVNTETVAVLDARKWQARHRVMFRRSEIEEAGRELVSAAQLIAQLDASHLFPVRNPAPWRCRGCAFKEICNDPSDGVLIDLNFDRVVPKRSRIPLLEGSIS